MWPIIVLKTSHMLISQFQNLFLMIIEKVMNNECAKNMENNYPIWLPK